MTIDWHKIEEKIESYYPWAMSVFLFLLLPGTCTFISRNHLDGPMDHSVFGFTTFFFLGLPLLSFLVVKITLRNKKRILWKFASHLHWILFILIIFNYETIYELFHTSRD